MPWEKKQEMNLLELIPVRRRPFERRNDGTIDVIVPRYGGTRLGRMLERVIKNEPIRLKLDRVGTLAWELCDGSRPVLTIAERLKESFGDEVEPVYDRLALFFVQMEKRDLIEWKIPDGGP